MKYRKKPVVVDAEVYYRGLEDGYGKSCSMTYLGCQDNCNDCPLYQPYIQTLEGRHYISPGDYIVTGVRGERYPVKPEIFKETYEIN